MKDNTNSNPTTNTTRNSNTNAGRWLMKDSQVAMATHRQSRACLAAAAAAHGGPPPSRGGGSRGVNKSSGTAAKYELYVLSATLSSI